MNQPSGCLPGLCPSTSDRSSGLSVGPDYEKPLIILVSSGYHSYREYLLKLVSQCSRVWLFLTQKPSWEEQYIVDHTIVDTLNSQAMIKAARKIAEAPYKPVSEYPGGLVSLKSRGSGAPAGLSSSKTVSSRPSVSCLTSRPSPLALSPCSMVNCSRLKPSPE